MTSEIVLIQHTETTLPGLVMPWLQNQPLPFHHIRLQKGEPLPAAKEGMALILCGGGVHVDQEHLYPWLKAERRFIESNLKLGNKIVGLCLGGQLCAQALGAKVAPHPEGWEIGWHDVRLHRAEGVPGFETNQIMKFSQYHRYIFEAPKDAVVLASNEWWAPQAFAWNKQVLAFQFHPERTLDGNRGCALSAELPSQGQIHSPREMLDLAKIHQPLAAAWFESLLNQFLMTNALRTCG